MADPILSFPADADERRHPRYAATLTGRVRELGSIATNVTVTELSIGGCRLTDNDLPAKAELWVTLGKAPPLRARVVWSKSGQAGCEFYAPLTRFDVRNLLMQRF